GFYYSFRIIDPVIDKTNKEQVSVSLKLAVMKTSAPPVLVKRSGQSPAAPTSNDPVVVSIVTSPSKSPEEQIYLRWSTDFFITSHLVLAAGSGSNYSATIPAQPAGTAVQYCALTSTVDLAPFLTSGIIDSLTLATTGTFEVVSTAAAPTSSPALALTPIRTATAVDVPDNS